jgi:type I restriction enzyme S subunit
VPLPSKSEQAEIVVFCESQKNKYEALINKAMHAINLMQERRTALISAAVTGKIDVRDWQPAAAQEEVSVEC